MLTHRFKRSAGRQTQTDAGSVKVKSGLNNSDKGWICWRTAAYYMTALCSAGCFYCYYRGNDTQWRGASARGIKLQLKEWITAVKMNPNSSSLFHNFKISWGFGVSGKANLSCYFCLLPFDSFTRIRQHLFICPIWAKSAGCGDPNSSQRPSERGGGWRSGITWTFFPLL